jgi:hypothetical protein
MGWTVDEPDTKMLPETADPVGVPLAAGDADPAGVREADGVPVGGVVAVGVAPPHAAATSSTTAGAKPRLIVRSMRNETSSDFLACSSWPARVNGLFAGR